VIAKRPRYALKGLVQQTSAGATNNQHLSVVAVVVPPPFTPPMRSSPDTAVAVPPPFTHPLRQVFGDDCLCQNQNGMVKVPLRILTSGAHRLDHIGRGSSVVAACSLPDTRTDVPVSLTPPVSDTRIDTLNDQVQALEVHYQKLVRTFTPSPSLVQVDTLNDHGGFVTMHAHNKAFSACCGNA
jgi:hypothetical protein